MTVLDKACWERGCPCYDSKEGDGVEVVKREWVGLTDEQQKALAHARNEAMLWTLKGRIPECGAFAGIAQNLDWLCDQFAVEAKLKEKNCSAANNS